MKNHFPNSVAEVKLNKLTSNIHKIKEKSSAESILAVVKCDAYRHGAVKCARHVEDMVDYFAVATVDEAIELRMGRIKKPILVFGVPTDATAAAYQTHDLTATISHKVHFSTLMDGTKYHLNFDTGMGRLGFSPDESSEVRQLAVANQRLICSGIYSHYATADDPGSNFVIEQLNRFKHILNEFSEIPLVHMSNTGAAVNYEVENFDMVRTGLGMLGYNSGQTRYDWLQPALQWSTKIAQLRYIRKDSPVSYSSTWKAPTDGWLATLPVGYGDGIPRSLSNRLKVSINGKLYPQVGNVTMDYIMVFMGDDKTSPGTKAELLGGHAWTAQDWAEHGSTNVHEVLTNITGRVEKSYLDLE